MIGKTISHYMIIDKLGEGGNFPKNRDIKPANIFITSDGVAKILDFGLAKLAGHTKLTKTGTTLGTVAFMSPEQTRGEEVNHRTDIWSLGVVLYEMITGQTPFKGEYEQAVSYAIVNEEPEPITRLRTGVPMNVANAAMTHYRFGDEKVAENHFDSLKKRARHEYIQPMCFIIIHLARGEMDQVFAWVKKAYEERDSFLPWFRVTPLDCMHFPSDPRIDELLDRLGLP